MKVVSYHRAHRIGHDIYFVDVSDGKVACRIPLYREPDAQELSDYVYQAIAKMKKWRQSWDLKQS